ncbi:MAG: hypothetical protein M3N28_02480 [Actinomycetota bacterium]|nr:hypothetical protein [Actinomycetota bacterium]
MTDHVPEADAIEQDLPPGGPPPSQPSSVGAEVPVADAIEQELPAGGPVSADPIPEEPSIPLGAPEADVIEQAQPGPLLEEDEGPR